MVISYAAIFSFSLTHHEAVSDGCGTCHNVISADGQYINGDSLISAIHGSVYSLDHVSLGLPILSVVTDVKVFNVPQRIRKVVILVYTFYMETCYY